MTQKTWGPFTGNHLTAIFGCIVLAIAVPSGLWAADTFSNVALYDPDSGKTVAFDSSLHLGVGDGNGPLTIDGTVSAKESPPTDWFRFYKSIPATTCQKVTSPELNKGQIVKTLVVNFMNGTSVRTVDFLLGTTCSNVIFQLSAPSPGITTIPLEPGLIIPVGQSLWARAPTNLSSVFGLAYRVPASALPTFVARD